MIFAALIGYLGKYNALKGDMVFGLGCCAVLEVLGELIILGNVLSK